MSRLPMLLAFAAALTAQAAEDRDTLYQVSTIDALLTGLYEPLATVGDVAQHGDIGLGTFASLDGELILLDGVVYQAKSDGRVLRVPDDTGTPFMAATYFDADRTLMLSKGQAYAEFKAWLEPRLPSRNVPYAVRVDARFERVSFRSVPRQEPPYRPLAEVADEQTLFEQSDINGTLIGFWCPTFTKGVNVPGFHLHFISDDRKHGGHLLDFRLAEGQVAFDLTSAWDVRFPLDPAFLHRDLGNDQSAALRRVEHGRSAK